MDLAIQEHLFPKGGEVSHSQHITVSGPLGTRGRDLIPECYFSGMVHSHILYHGLQDNKQMCLKFQFRVTLGPRSTQMMCTHTLSRERVRSTSRTDQRYTHVHDNDADVGGATLLEGNEKIAASDSLDVKNRHSHPYIELPSFVQTNTQHESLI